MWDISNIIISLKNDINALTASQAGIVTAVGTLSDNYTALEARVKSVGRCTANTRTRRK